MKNYENFPRILLVDDDPMFRRVVDDFLSSRNFLVDISSNVEEGLGFLKKGEYDLVLSDIVMPEVDGIPSWKSFS